MNKRISSRVISLILTLSMMLSVTAMSVTTASGAESGFADVSQNDWFYESVVYVSDNGIMNGVGDGRFAPLDSMSRAMSATILYRMAGSPAVSGKHPFTDVASGSWYTDAVKWAYSSGIVNGKTDTSFAPDDEISRAEFATLFWRYAEYKSLALPKVRSGNIGDESSIPFYARTAVQRMYQAEIINGRADYKFYPHAKVTRSEAAAIIERFVTNAVPADSVVTPVEPEYDPEIYLDIAFLGNSFTYTGSTASHLDEIARDKLVRVRDYSKTLFSLSQHYEYFTNEKHKDELEDVIATVDIIIFQEISGDFPDEYYAEKLMDLFGHDKTYYGLLPFDGPSYSDEIYSWGSLNSYYKEIAQYYREELNIEIIYISHVSSFDKNVPIYEKDLIIVNDYHPNLVFGYAIALGVYSVIFDEPASEQNDGHLSLYIIPGETEAEKYAFIKLLKETVQRIVEFQKDY